MRSSESSRINNIYVELGYPAGDISGGFIGNMDEVLVTRECYTESFVPTGYVSRLLEHVDPYVLENYRRNHISLKTVMITGVCSYLIKEERE